jgi:hypothetical protein
MIQKYEMFQNCSIIEVELPFLINMNFIFRLKPLNVIFLGQTDQSDNIINMEFALSNIYVEM